MTTSMLLGEIKSELKRIGRPVVREELSYLPFIPEMTDKILAIRLDLNEEPVILISGGAASSIAITEAHSRLMDKSDLTTLLYMLQQIH